LGIGIVIFGVIHVPLPQADYHNIRHHDGPGEVCPYHDHLLRWHSSATDNADVALLHWHWFVPQGELGDRHERAGDADRGPVSGLLLHAHMANSLVPDWPGEPVTQCDARYRLLDQLTLTSSTESSALNSGELAVFDLMSRRRCADRRESGGPLRAAQMAIFQRWNC
jgi:hypothetical protein